jgi:hypothetical protein
MGCYCDPVKNVTISLPNDVYRRARIWAAARDMSLSALVRELLMKLGNEETDSERRKRLQAEVLGSIARFKAGDRLSRDDTHARARLR